MSNIHPISLHYRNLWRGALTHLLKWPSERVEQFVSHWQHFNDNEGHTILYHDSAGSYVAPFMVSDALQRALRSEGRARELHGLFSRIANCIEQEYQYGMPSDTIDWAAIREEIVTELALFGEDIPNVNQTTECWEALLGENSSQSEEKTA